MRRRTRTGEEVSRISCIFNGSMMRVEQGASNTVHVALVHQPSGLV